MSTCFFKTVLIGIVLALGTAQQTYVTILEYADYKCTNLVAGFAFPLNQCITQSVISSMFLTSTASTGALVLTLYGSTADCSGTGSQPYVPYTVGSGCSSLFLSGLYYTVSSKSFSTVASALQATTSYGAGAVIASYQNSACTLQSTKNGSTTNGLPGEVSFLLYVEIIFVVIYH